MQLWSCNYITRSPLQRQQFYASSERLTSRKPLRPLLWLPILINGSVGVDDELPSYHPPGHWGHSTSHTEEEVSPLTGADTDTDTSRVLQCIAHADLDHLLQRLARFAIKIDCILLNQVDHRSFSIYTVTISRSLALFSHSRVGDDNGP